MPVPKPHDGAEFFCDSFWWPMDDTNCDVTGPGEFSPKAPFSCSLEMKICA